MRFFFICIISIFLSQIFYSVKSVAATSTMVFLGDSLTEGYGVKKESAFPALIEKKLQESGLDWKVVNSGVSGSTTASAVSRIKWVLQAKPKVIVLALGANDGLRGLKTEETQKNLSEAIDLAKKENVKIILCGLYMPPNYGKKYTDDFKKLYLNLSKNKKIPLIPFLLDKVAGDSQLNQGDGIHPNENGHKVIAETVYKFLLKELP